ncbi:MAG: hypothetical protein HC850_17135 [Rhodomicrobium sp.]|nr:hypothetical protein [Rhodomicrobium sp.]
MSISVKSTKIRNTFLRSLRPAAAIGATVGVAEAKHKKHFGVMINLGSPYYSGYSGYGYGYNSSCRWLKRKAIHTGSPYWWKRYQYCIYG